MLVALLIIVVAIVSYFNMKSISDNMTTLYDDNTLPLQYIGEADTAMYTIRGDVYKYILLPEERTTIGQAIQTNEITINDRINKFKATNSAKQDLDIKVALAF